MKEEVGKKAKGSPDEAPLVDASENLERMLRMPLDPLLTDAVRLKLLAALIGLPEGGGLGFGALRGLLGLTDGNLGSHLSVLTEAGYVESAKVRVRKGRKTRSLYAASPEGRAAFGSHVRALEAVIAASHGDPYVP